MENMVSALQNFLRKNVSFANLKWITGKTNIVWGWLVWKQGIAACRPDHNILLWTNQELRWSPNLGRAAGVPTGSSGPGTAAKLHLPGSKTSDQLAGQWDQGQWGLRSSQWWEMEILGNTESMLPHWKCYLGGKHEKVAAIWMLWLLKVLSSHQQTEVQHFG